MESEHGFDNVVKSVVRFHHWEPEKIDKLFMDDFDFKGLYYWYEDVKDYNRQLEESTKKP